MADSVSSESLASVPHNLVQYDSGLEVVQPELEVVPETSAERKTKKKKQRPLVAAALKEDEAAAAPPRDLGWDKEVDPRGGRARVCGVSKRIFWLLLACVLLAVVALAIGLGVGLSQRKNASNGADSSQLGVHTITTLTTGTFTSGSATITYTSSATLTVSDMTSTATSNTPTSATTTPIGTALTESNSLTTAASTSHTSTATSSSAPSPTATSVLTGCPITNGTTYTDPSGVAFQVFCGLDFLGLDIRNVQAASMAECVTDCVNEAGCAGAVWFNAGPQGTLFNYCWMKYATNGTTSTNTDAESVVRI